MIISLRLTELVQGTTPIQHPHWNQGLNVLIDFYWGEFPSIYHPCTLQMFIIDFCLSCMIHHCLSKVMSDLLSQTIDPNYMLFTQCGHNKICFQTVIGILTTHIASHKHILAEKTHLLKEIVLCWG